MRFGLFFVLGCAATTPLICAGEKLPVLKAGSDIYSNVTITAVSATDVYFTYDRGMGNAKLKNLEPALQKHFQYDPQNARQTEQKQAAANAQYHLNAINQPAPKSSGHGNENAGQTSSPAAAPGKKIWAKSYLNQKAPELVVEKWLTSEPDRRGKFVLIDFWATWCPPCVEETPSLVRMQSRLKDKGVVVLAVSIDADDAAYHKFLKEYSVNMVTVRDEAQKAATLYGTFGWPESYVIDRNGVIRRKFIGPVDWTNPEVTDYLSKL